MSKSNSKCSKKEKKCNCEKIHAKKVQACELKACDADIKDLKVKEIHADTIWTHTFCGNSPITVMDTLNCQADNVIAGSCDVGGDSNVAGNVTIGVASSNVSPNVASRETTTTLTVNGSEVVSGNCTIGGDHTVGGCAKPKCLEVRQGPSTFYGDVIFKDMPKVVRVPTDQPTLVAALTYVFASQDIKAFRIVLETQGPHALPASRYNSDLDYLSIEAKTKTDHMGMYYGHLAAAFGVLGNKNEVDITKSGAGPFSLALTNSNKTITVSGTSILGPNPVPPAGGPACIPYPNAFIGAGGVSPNFTALLAGDKIRWFSTATNVVTELTIGSVLGNAITLTSAVPTPVTRGDGFSVKPRASITLGVGPLLPELIIKGVMQLTGLFFPAVAPGGSFPALIIAEGKNHTDLRQCLFEATYATGSTITYAYAPNTFMDSTNGVSQAKLVSNAGGNVLAFGQTFVGKLSGFEGFACNVHTICFSTYVGCDRGVSHRFSGSKHDFNDFIKCQIGVFAEGSGRPSQACWFWHCKTAIKLRMNSSFENVPPSSVGFPDLPMIIQGDPADLTCVGIDLDYNSQVNGSILRMCDVAKHGIIDGVTITTFPDIFPPSRTLVSNASAPNTSYGVRNSGVVYDIFTGGSCGCP